MKKLLTATTALALVGGMATAEITISGDAKFAFDYNSEPGEGMSKHQFKHEMGVDFTGSGTTDGGLTFGGSAGFDTGDADTNEGTVFISGAFGKLTFGANDSADLLAGGIADVGTNGIGVDDVAEELRGTTADQFRYDHTFGAVSIAISAGTKDGKAAVAEVPDTVWTLTGYQNRIFQFGMAPTIANFDTAFSFTRDATTLTPTHNTNLAMAGMGYQRIEASVDLSGQAGYSRDDDGFLLLEGEKIPVANAATPMSSFSAPTALDAATGLTEFNRYLAAYNLGDDHVIGGADDAADSPKADLAMGNGSPAEPGMSADNQYAFGMSFVAGGVTVGIGHDSEGTTSAGLGFSTGDIGTNLLYVKGKTAKSMGADVSYAMGASTLTLAYAQQSPDMGAKKDAMGLGVVHDLGGGAKLNAGFGKVDDKNKASIGLTFAF